MEMKWNLSSDQLRSERSAALVVIAGLVQLVPGFGEAPDTVTHRVEVDGANHYLILETHSLAFFLSHVNAHVLPSWGGIYTQLMCPRDCSLNLSPPKVAPTDCSSARWFPPDCLPSFLFVLGQNKGTTLRGCFCPNSLSMFTDCKLGGHILSSENLPLYVT